MLEMQRRVGSPCIAYAKQKALLPHTPLLGGCCAEEIGDLICSACAQVFLHMQSAARTDKGCTPNVITFSALITAFVAGGRLDRAYEIFMSMRPHGVAPDHICYSTLIAGEPLTCSASCAKD